MDNLTCAGTDSATEKLQQSRTNALFTLMDVLLRGSRESLSKEGGMGKESSNNTSMDNIFRTWAEYIHRNPLPQLLACMMSSPIVAL
jgi:hypothetical protein